MPLWLKISWVGVLVWFALLPFDYDLTLWFTTHSDQSFIDFFSQSIFEGEPPGLGDVGTVLCIVSWLAIFAMKFGLVLPPWFRRWADGTACAGLLAGYTVQSLKWVVGRTRPGGVFEDGLPLFRPLFGPIEVSAARFISFPSGHTMSACLALFIVPLIFRSRIPSRWILIVLLVSSTIAMAATRSMVSMHWTSDSLASLIIGLSLYAGLEKAIYDPRDQDLAWRTLIICVKCLPLAAILVLCRLVIFPRI
jgi:membrane-associated phospholipid phosphatase